MFYEARLGQDDATWYDLKAQFLNYWNQLKSFISSLTNLDRTIIQQNSRLQVAKQNAATPAQLAAIQQAIDRNVSYYNLWADIKSKINQYMPDWLSAEAAASAGPPQAQQATQDLSPEEQETTVMTTTGSPGTTTTTTTTVQGLGIIPLILISAAALAALAYVAVKGLELLKQVNSENQVIAGLEKGLLTTSQVSALLPYGVSNPSAQSALSLGTIAIFAVPIIVGLWLMKVARS